MLWKLELLLRERVLMDLRRELMRWRLGVRLGLGLGVRLGLWLWLWLCLWLRLRLLLELHDLGLKMQDRVLLRRMVLLQHLGLGSAFRLAKQHSTGSGVSLLAMRHLLL